MKVLFVNTMHSSGGAAVAAFRIMDALAAEGVETRILLLEPKPGDPRVVPNPRFFSRHYGLAKLAERLPVLAYRRRWQNFRHLEFSPCVLPSDSSDAINSVEADIVHLHWVNHGHLSPEGIGRITRPIVWTAHDMWPFTGGCHYSGTCERYEEQCGCCPVLGSDDPQCWSYYQMQRKQTHWSGRTLSLVCPSHWLAGRAGLSALFRDRPISVIPNPLDLELFSPGDRDAARRRLGLPLNQQIVLFGAHKGVRNPAKGFSLLDAALAAIAARKGAAKPLLAIVGAGESQRAQVKADVPVHFLGVRPPDRMADVYRAADLFALPSLHETLPNMVAEAMACGTPAVAFNVGGVPDMIEDGQDGYLAKPYQVSDMEAGIRFCLDHPNPERLRAAARASAEKKFNARLIARRYMTVYRDTLGGGTLQSAVTGAGAAQ